MKNLKKIYGDKTVVDIPQLTLGSGELIGLVGNNGAGKTTLMRLILDLIILLSDKNKLKVLKSFVYADFKCFPNRGAYFFF